MSWFARARIMQFAALMPFHAMRPLVAYRALEMGATPAQLGIVAGSFAVLSFVSAVPLGSWVDRYGESRLLIVGPLVLFGSGLALGNVGSLAALAAIHALLGLGQVITIVALQTLVANGGSPSQRDSRFGSFMLVGSISQMIGPAAGAFVLTRTRDGSGTVFLLCAAVICVSFLFAITLWLHPPDLSGTGRALGTPRVSMTRAVRQAMGENGVPLAMLASLTVLASLDLLTAYLPAYGEEKGISVQTVGLLLSTRASAAVVSRMAVARLVARFGRSRVLVQNMAIATAAFLLLPFADSPWLLFTLMAVAGFGAGILDPLTLSWIAGRVAPDLRGTAIGLRLTGNRLGQFVIPLLLGLVGSAGGIGAIFISAGVMMGASAALIASAPAEAFTEGPEGIDEIASGPISSE